jgi:hypothetical protein
MIAGRGRLNPLPSLRMAKCLRPASHCGVGQMCPEADFLSAGLHVANVPITGSMAYLIRSPHRRASGRRRSTGVWVRAQAALSKPIIKSRVIGTASRLVDSSI